MPQFRYRRSVPAGPFLLTLESQEDGFEVFLEASGPEEAGLELTCLKLSSHLEARPGVYRLSWSQPLVGIHAYWRPGTTRARALPADWEPAYTVQSTNNAPVGCLFSQDGLNRHTFAFSDALNPVEIMAGVNEETATFVFSLTLFNGPSAPFKDYQATLRLDTRSLPYYLVLDQVQQWWAGWPGYRPAPVPPAARQPMYSTWYSFHQGMLAAEIEQQCRLAGLQGCRAVIVDDGWQTSNNDRGYAYCGDWQVWPEKFPDMAAHVRRVHKLGLRYILWYAVPFVGPLSRNFSLFSGKYLGYLETFQAWALDPRYPEVRDFLIGIYEQAVREWGVDGFKLDFVQHFKQPSEENPQAPGGRDYASVPAATDRLLSDIMERLRRLNPDILIEFRQPYTGPLMRKYGNMFRAGDCPSDSLENRVRTLDIRLLGGQSATHSDMLMWSPAEPLESAALQIINILFSVPQISVLLDQIPDGHRQMLAYWLAFWLDHQALLLDGQLKPLHPELNFPVVETTQGQQQLIASYQSNNVLQPANPLPSELIIVNGTLTGGLALRFAGPLPACLVEIRSCTGAVVSTETVNFPAGLAWLAVPPAGLAFVRPTGQ